MAKPENPLTGEALIKEVCRRIRVARSYWDAHNNAACRGERVKRSYSEGNRAFEGDSLTKSDRGWTDEAFEPKRLKAAYSKHLAKTLES